MTIILWFALPDSLWCWRIVYNVFRYRSGHTDKDSVAFCPRTRYDSSLCIWLDSHWVGMRCQTCNTIHETCSRHRSPPGNFVISIQKFYRGPNCTNSNSVWVSFPSLLMCYTSRTVQSCIRLSLRTVRLLFLASHTHLCRARLLHEHNTTAGRSQSVRYSAHPQVDPYKRLLYNFNCCITMSFSTSVHCLTAVCNCLLMCSRLQFSFSPIDFLKAPLEQQSLIMSTRLPKHIDR